MQGDRGIGEQGVLPNELPPPCRPCSAVQNEMPGLLERVDGDQWLAGIEQYDALAPVCVQLEDQFDIARECVLAYVVQDPFEHPLSTTIPIHRLSIRNAEVHQLAHLSVKSRWIHIYL